MALDISTSLPSSCEVTIPSPGDKIEEVLSDRWGQLTNSTHPSAIVVPSSEDDVIAVVKYAASHGLRIIPAAGQVAIFVVVNAQTVYLDMKNFSQVEINTDAETVTVGGGSRWSDVISSVASKGYYTSKSDAESSWLVLINLPQHGLTLVPSAWSAPFLEAGSVPLSGYTVIVAIKLSPRMLSHHLVRD
jgi:hypothetical protein